MTKKPVSIEASFSRKSAAAVLPEAATGGGETKTLTLRLPIVTHDQLREMAFTARRSQHSLLMEALNLLFEQHGKPPIAPIQS